MMVPSSQSPSDGGMNINISAIARKIDVDNRISLRFYFRIADNILKQAAIFREENNVIDLYVMLLRFSSLVSETIPYHRDYRTSSQSNKLYLKKKLMAAVSELERLNPVVKAKLQELQRKQIYQHNNPQKLSQDRMLEYSQPSVKQKWNGWNATQPLSSEFDHQRPKTLTLANTGAEHLRKLTLSIPRPKEETLSKHSILGPAGLSGHWQPPSNLKVQYPSTIDLTPLQFPRDSDNQQSVKDENRMSGDNNISEQERSNSDSVVPQPKNDTQLVLKQDSDNLISFDAIESSPQTVVIRQPSPPPLLADVEDLIPTPSSDTQIESVSENASTDPLPCSEDPLQLHISTELMNSFMKLAKSNTDKNLETCGVLAGTLKNRKFCITALIIPKQESTSDSCQTTNEEEIFEVQDKRSLFPLGWIHTHPTQSCFMSSIDVHTHYSYQIMLPESIAIVMAPRDTSRKHGIFRLTSGGMTVIRQCPKRGFHPHDPPSDGSPIYRHCTDIYMNPSLKCEVIDLR